MKKRILTLIVVLSLCVCVCCSACGLGNVIENNKPGSTVGTTKPDDPNNPGGDDDPSKPPNPDTNTNDFVVSVYYNKVLFDPNNNTLNPGLGEITVVWRNESGIVRKPLGADGKANAGELQDESYTVYLEGLPSKYSYRCGYYTATQTERKVSINVVDIQQPTSGNGTGFYSDAFQFRKEGMYRATIKNSSQSVHYMFSPAPDDDKGGYYTITSWVNVYEDEIKTKAEWYGGNAAFVNWYDKHTIDDGGYSLKGGFTKNFKMEYNVDNGEVGNALLFRIFAETKTIDYPITVDFEVLYVSGYHNPDLDVRIKRAKDAKVKAKEPAAGEKLVYADFGTRTFSMDNFKFNEDTGFYHRYSMELYGDDSYGYGKGYGPILMCYILPRIPSFTWTTLYEANSYGELGTNLLMLYNCWVEEEQAYCAYDYQDFIRIDYYKVCNSNGLCYVTQELQEFLQGFASNQRLWADGDGITSGTPEALGYYAQRDALWLFACGFYSKEN